MGTRDRDGDKPGANRLEPLDDQDPNGQFVLELADILRTPDIWPGSAEVACRLLGEHLAASRVCYLDRARDQWVVRGSYSADPAHLDDPARLATIGQNLVERHGQREFVVSNDVPQDVRLAAADRAYLRAIGAMAHASVVLRQARRRVAALVVQSATRRVWSRSDLGLIAQAADRTWIAAEHGRAAAARDRQGGAPAGPGGGPILSAETVGMFAHNLRSPLSAILLNATLPLPAPGQVERRSRAPTEAIGQSIAEMNQLLDELVDLSRIAAGGLDVYQERLPAEALLIAAAAAHRDRAADQDVTLQIDPLPRLPPTWADKRRVLQVFHHLITGALSAVHGGAIRLGAERADGKIRFWVTARVRRTAHPGHLRPPPDGSRGAVARALVQGIVEAHGGDMRIESHARLGSTVWFTLPCASRSGADHSPAVRSRARGEARRVLMIDDASMRDQRRRSGVRSRGEGKRP